SDDKEYPARVLARDPVQDLAIIKIEGTGFTPLKLGSSSDVQIGQTAIAIGNALGELQNTVSVGVISGLGRTVTASGQGMVETLEDIIQTDAAINQGNSGGPLLNLSGEVIGINTAVDLSGENIGFAIPIDKAIRGISQVKESGKISYPFLGVRYLLIDEDWAEEEDLPVDYGALLIEGMDFSQPAVTPDSPADSAGLQEGDIILEMAGEKITKENSLAKIIARYSPGDTVVLKILRNDEEIIKSVVLSEWK
ncbi:MAG: trypsin-like peptidase domain-containing protein, partial [Candidatus Pacebacteria bacterium]|nr:trypsin-like peptidase domain-containing protein [Candidatus Paceibacterota bacterium]